LEEVAERFPDQSLCFLTFETGPPDSDSATVGVNPDDWIEERAPLIPAHCVSADGSRALELEDDLFDSGDAF
jgi:hypothetical protein